MSDTLIAAIDALLQSPFGKDKYTLAGQIVGLATKLGIPADYARIEAAWKVMPSHEAPSRLAQWKGYLSSLRAAALALQDLDKGNTLTPCPVAGGTNAHNFFAATSAEKERNRELARRRDESDAHQAARRIALNKCLQDIPTGQQKGAELTAADHQRIAAALVGLGREGKAHGIDRALFESVSGATKEENMALDLYKLGCDGNQSELERILTELESTEQWTRLCVWSSVRELVDGIEYLEFLPPPPVATPEATLTYLIEQCDHAETAIQLTPCCRAALRQNSVEKLWKEVWERYANASNPPPDMPTDVDSDWKERAAYVLMANWLKEQRNQVVQPTTAGDTPPAAGAGDHDTPPAAERAKLTADEWVWAPEGNGYRVAGLGERGFFMGLKGLAMIEQLVRSPGQPVPMVLLAGGAGEQPDNDKRSKQPAMDMKAMQDAYDRATALRAEVAQAEAEGRAMEAAESRAELERLEQTLKTAVGLKGKARDLNNPTERHRSAIAARLRDVYKAMRGAKPPMPKLAAHLEQAISAESPAYIYRPTLSPPPSWKTSLSGQ